MGGGDRAVFESNAMQKMARSVIVKLSLSFCDG